MYPHERSLVQRLDGKPFVILGVNSDRDRTALKSVLEEEDITWRSFWNGEQGTSGPISKAWNVHGWPTMYVIDAQGKIRYKSVGSPGAQIMDKWVDTLVAEVEGKAKDSK